MNPLIEARNHRHDFVGFGLAGQSVAHDASLTKHPDSIHQIKHLTQVVADDNDRNTLLLQTSDDLLDPGGFLNTQCRRWLVQYDELFTPTGGSSNRKTLALTA